MREDVPMACTLTGAHMTERLADLRALGARSLAGVAMRGKNATLRFGGEPEWVERFVAAERGCCSFLEFDVARLGDSTEVSIHTPAGGEPVLRGLVAAVVAGWEEGLTQP
jgi:hypothetical protein